MTLLIAGIHGPTLWMIADTAITGGLIDERARQFQIKIIPSRDGNALIGFSGDQYHGTRLAEKAATLPAGIQGVEELLTGHKEYSSTEFAYGYFNEGVPKLFRISEGQAIDLQTLHLGN